MPLAPLLRPRIKANSEAGVSNETKDAHLSSSGFLNVFTSLKLLRHPGTLIISTCFGIYYMIQTCIAASLSTIFVDTYDISGLIAGLIYIPFGLGSMGASYVVGASTLHQPSALLAFPDLKV